MSDPWSDLLDGCERESMILPWETVRNWPPGAIEFFVDSGLLVETVPAEGIWCPECPDDPYHDVFWLDPVCTGASKPYVSCPSHGPWEVPAVWLKRWRIEWTAFLTTVITGLATRDHIQEIVRGRLWKLGGSRLEGRDCTIWMGRRLHQRNACDLVASVRLTPRSIVLVPRRLPRQALPGNWPLLTIESVSHWSAEELRWDRDLIRETADQPPENVVSPAPPTRKMPRRASRVCDIEALSKELQEHMRTARDYATATLDRSGTPKLLPRPTQKELAKRLGITESRISRSLNDESARELRFLWELALDVDRLIGCSVHG